MHRQNPSKQASRALSGHRGRAEAGASELDGVQAGAASLRDSRKQSAAETAKPRAELGRRAEVDSEEDIYSEIDGSARAPSTLMNITGHHQNATHT